MSIREKLLQTCSRHAVIFWQQTVLLGSLGIELTLRKRVRARLTKSSVRKANLWSLSRKCFLLLPTMTIPFSEISLTGILQFPVFIPSPIGMELTEISISLVHFTLSLSKREATNREKAFKLIGKVGKVALKSAKVGANVIMKVVEGLAEDNGPSRRRRKYFGPV